MRRRAVPRCRWEGNHQTVGLAAISHHSKEHHGDGQAYMVWSRRRMIKLKPDLVKPDGPEIAIATKRQGYSEGPILFERNGIYYYLYTLGGGEKYQYAYMMSRTSPLGPWEGPADDIIATADH